MGRVNDSIDGIESRTPIMGRVKESIDGVESQFWGKVKDSD